MGYTTDFNGSFKLNRPATVAEKNYINTFSRIRHMRRDVNILMDLYKGSHGLLGTSAETHTPEQIYGVEGAYFAKDDNNYGQDRDNSILDYNQPPNQLGFDNTVSFDERWKENQKRVNEGSCVPALWCQWVLNDEGTEVEWDGGEKFYEYIAWIKYLITHFFQPWGIVLNGEVEWSGEERGDIGKIVITNNEVKVLEGSISYK